MAGAARARTSPLRALKRFVRSPKGYLLFALLILAAVAAPTEGLSRVEPRVAGAVLAAALVDLALVRWLRGTWIFPSGAILTGLIVAMVLSAEEPLAVPILTSAIAVGSKYLFRSRWSNVFNPAALALVVAYFVFSSGESWWGALPDLPVYALILLLVIGVLVADYVNKLPLVLVFLATYFLLFTLSTFLGDPSQVTEIFRAPDLNTVLFFAFFMLDDPPTAPARYTDQVWFGMIVASVSWAVFLALGAEYFVLAGLLVANAWETVRRFDDFSARRAVVSG